GPVREIPGAGQEATGAVGSSVPRSATGDRDVLRVSRLAHGGRRVPAAGRHQRQEPLLVHVVVVVVLVRGTWIEVLFLTDHAGRTELHEGKREREGKKTASQHEVPPLGLRSVQTQWECHRAPPVARCPLRRLARHPLKTSPPARAAAHKQCEVVIKQPPPQGPTRSMSLGCTSTWAE